MTPLSNVTFAGSGTPAYADGIGTLAAFVAPTGIAADSYGNMYVADSVNHRIRKVAPTGVVTTLAGNGAAAYADGNGADVAFNNPQKLAVDVSGHVYVADAGNNVLRKVSPSGMSPRWLVAGPLPALTA
jgi:sugar lactone lactonase YvrE